MAKYLTPAMYYLADDSIPGASSIDSQVLDRTIRRAESLIDTYIGFDARWGGFEPHVGGSFQAEFDEYSLRIRIPNFPTPVRDILRYRIQVSNTSGGDGFFANINWQDVVINNVAGYIEIVPLQSITYSMTPFMWGLGLRPPIVQLDYEAGFYLAATGETLGNASQDNQTYRALRGFWSSTYKTVTFLQPQTLPAAPPVVYVNGTVADPSTYTVDYTEGVVTFNTPNAAGAKVTADYCYTIPDPVTDATVAQVTWMLSQRQLNLMGLGGIEVARSRDQQIKRHIRTSSGASNKDEPAIASEAMQLLEPYTYIPIG